MSKFHAGDVVYITNPEFRKKMEDLAGEPFNFFGQVGGEWYGTYYVKFLGKESKQTVHVDAEESDLATPSMYDNVNIEVIPERLDYKKCKENNDMILSVRPEDMPNV